MRYKAILQGQMEGLERSKQCYGVSEEALLEWIRKTLETYPSGHVEVYEIREVLFSHYEISDGEIKTRKYA